jgi:intein/homing endonuclease
MVNIEELSLKERMEYIDVVVKCRNDPIYFMKEILGWKSIFKMQEEITRTFYRHLYDENAPEYKKLIIRAGQRCTAHSRIATSSGLIYIEDLYPKNIEKIKNNPEKLYSIKVFNGNKYVSAKEIIYAGKKPMYRLTTRYGFIFDCSENHKFYTFNGSEFLWKELKDLKIGEDYIELHINTHIDGDDKFSDDVKHKLIEYGDINKNLYTLPLKLTPEMATLMGMLIADGSISSKKGNIKFTKTDNSLLNIFKEYIKSQFNLNVGNCKHSGDTMARELSLYSISVRYFLYLLGLDYKKSDTKYIPYTILNGTKDLKIAFLSGYFSCDGNVQESKSNNGTKCRVTSTTVSERLAYELQNLLLELGILSSISIGKSVEYGSRIKRKNNAYTLNVFGSEILKFYELITLVSQPKQELFNEVYKSQKNKKSVGKLVPINPDIIKKYFTITGALYHIINGNTKTINLDKCKSFYKGNSDIVDRLLDPSHIYLPIKSINYTEKEEDMYDLYVPDGNCYIANGIMTHNSGKTALGSKICGYEFFKLISLDNPAEHFGLMKNQNISISCVAPSKKQAADNIFATFLTDFQENEWINQWFDLKYIGDERIECKKKHVFVEVAPAKIDTGSGTGATSAAVFADEIDLWHNQSLSKLNASLVWSKMINSTQTLGIKGKCIAISSVQEEHGMINQLYDEGLNEETTLTYDLKTWEFNDRLTKAKLLEEYKYKMDMFWRDFANQPSAASGHLFPGNSLNLNRSQYNVFELGYVPEEVQGWERVMAADPAFRNDAFGMACGYTDGEWIIVDGVAKFQKDVESNEPYLKPSEIEDYILRWVPELNVSTFIYDVDLILPTVEKLENNGVRCIKHTANIDTYTNWVTFNDNRGNYKLSVPYNEHLKRECQQLTKEELPSGKLRVDHPQTKTGSKDIADCVANVIWHLSTQESGIIRLPVVPIRAV